MAAMIHFGMSGNKKTGKMLVSTTPATTCPDTCSFKEKGCYAKYGPLGIHWKHVTNGSRAKPLAEYLQAIKQLPAGSIHRMNQAGDLIGDNLTIDSEPLKAIVDANIGRRGFTYTHKPMNDHNAELVKYANDNGFTVNLSSDTLEQADANFKLGIAPVVLVVARDAEKVSYTPAGNKVVVCPAQNVDKITCATCKLCAVSKRNYIIGFRAHGSAAKTVEIIAKG